MGIINFGVPFDFVDFLKEKLGLQVFAEGGTFKGGTANKMSNIFKKVYTIEKSNVMFDISTQNLSSKDNVILLKGDTRYHLKQILNDNDNILFWLDAHWSGGDTYGQEDECPLLEELDLIFKCTEKNYVVLIDDARLFLAPPPLPHDFSKWPTIQDIIHVIPSNFKVTILDDVMYVYPNKINHDFKHLAQQKATEAWKEYGKNNEDRFFKGCKIAVKGILKWNF
ncbi:hypothetical protein [Desulfonatronum thioautotrophicum]|uniref:hypothetical protein n=1 Tax=Desulfonatronum thioautotrophicum TaxID=617001 RepID=UPI00069C9D2A|nr:hypothetical protein [Desulfonatronum thioautotrophicum]